MALVQIIKKCPATNLSHHPQIVSVLDFSACTCLITNSYFAPNCTTTIISNIFNKKCFSYPCKHGHHSTMIACYVYLCSIALTQPLKAEYAFTQARLASSTGTPEYLKEALGMKKPKHSRSSSNGKGAPCIF